MIDFSKLTMLIGPRFRLIKSQRFDREKLAHAKARQAKMPKNHGTNKRRSHQARQRAARHKRWLVERDSARSEFLKAARAYWTGESDVHPFTASDTQ